MSFLDRLLRNARSKAAADKPAPEARAAPHTASPIQAPAGARDGAAGSPERATQLIDEGNALEDAGTVDAALARYDAAIAQCPNLPRAHLNRGNALLALERVDDATAAYGAALTHDPGYAPAHCNLGNAQVRAGLSDAAIVSYTRALAIKPQFFDAEVALGALYHDLGRLDDAAGRYRRALALAPDFAPVHLNLGNVQRDARHFDDAMESYRRALALDPQLLMARYGLGTALQGLRKHEEAAACYRDVTERAPDFALAHGNLGMTQQALGRADEAIASFRRAVALVPELAAAHYSLGNALYAVGRRAEAEASLREAVKTAPDHADAHCMLGNLLFDTGRLHDAVAHYNRMLELAPSSAIAHNNLGNAWRQLGEYDNAIAAYERARAIDPALAAARSNLLFLHNALADMTPEALLEEAERFGALAAGAARPYSTWRGAADPGRPLRVGFVSGDLRSHPVGYFVDSVFAALAGAASELSLYAYSSHPGRDDVSARIARSCAGWCDASALDDEALARRIHDDAIDILIDLSGHTAFNRLQAFAWKPAPVQATWLGYLGTTGVEEIDYLLADAWTLPPEEERWFSEKIWRLPESYVCFTAPDLPIEPGPLPALASGSVTFASFNNLFKMNDAVVALWAQVLHAVPGSRLLLKALQLQEGLVRRHVAERFARHAIDPARVLLEGLVDRKSYLEPFQRVDIGLDPFPYPGITTTVENLWMGVPVLTLAGRSFMARQGVGLMNNAGLSDWIASDERDYVARAARHAADLQRLAHVRAGLRKRVLASPIFDAHAFARNFNAALRGMWRERYNDRLYTTAVAGVTRRT